MARPRLLIEPGITKFRTRVVVRELPTEIEGASKRRHFLVRCEKCNCLSRGTARNLRLNDCMCLARGGRTKPDSKQFKEIVAPAIASITGTIYGGRGHFWKEFPDGDMRVNMVIREG